MDDWAETVAVLALGAIFLVLNLMVTTLVALLTGWVVMVALGDLHAAVPAVPTLGYLASFASVWALALVARPFHRPVFSGTTRSDQR